MPWEDDLAAKTSFDYFVDVLSDIPCFLQEVMREGDYGGLPTPPNSTPYPDYIWLQGQLLERLERLKQLHENWLTTYSKPVWSTTPSAETLQGQAEAPFDTVLHFSDMYRGWDFCTYTTTLILTMMLYVQVSYHCEPSLSHLTPLQKLFPQTSVRQLINDICRSTEYLLLDIHGSRGYIILMFPATVAYFASDRGSLEAKWLHDICKRHAGSSGFGFGDFALDQVMPLSMWMDEYKRLYQAAPLLLQDSVSVTAQGKPSLVSR